MIVEREASLVERERIIAEKEMQLAERDRLIAVRDAELYAKTLQIEHLKAQLALLRRARFGRSSEKLDREIEQLELLIGEFEEGVAESEARSEQADDKKASPLRAKPRKHKPTGRKPLPAHLPREQIIHAPQGAVPVAAARCCARSAMLSPKCLSTCHQPSRWWSTCGRQ
jgi:transposase